jgi:hypothetical protein
MLQRRVSAVVAMWVVAGAALAGPPGAHNAPEVAEGGNGGVGVVKMPDPNDPSERAYAAAQKKRNQIEKELKQLRAKYFRSTKSVEMRQVGIAELKKYDDPALFPLFIELFKDEDADVRKAVLDHLCDLNSDEADATVAWSAVFDRDKKFRGEAAERVVKRVEKVGASHRVQSVIATGLRSKKDDTVAAAAHLAQVLKLYEAIPMMISSQIVGGGGGDNGGDSALAYILIGQQVAFVSDLQPVVGDSAVAFDPTVSVATDGVILRIIDAYVITYRVEVHNSLTALASDGWGGQPTAQLGWDNKKWNEWYAKEFVPYREKLDADKAAAGPETAAKPPVK